MSMSFLRIITVSLQVDEDVTGLMAQITDAANNTNNCPIPVTWFTLAQGSSCSVIQAVWKRGDELATHTATHKKLDAKLPMAAMEIEITGGRDYVVNQCKIPASDVVGFRSTYLVTNPAVREVYFLFAEHGSNATQWPCVASSTSNRFVIIQVTLASLYHHLTHYLYIYMQVVHRLGFLYDSSIDFSMAEQGGGTRPWPFTMDHGTAQLSCPPKFQPCDPSEMYPKLWQVPIWDLVYDGQIFTMDPGAHSEGNGKERPTFDVLKAMFDASYSGNRAPLPIYVHNFWFTPERVAGVNKFIQYALQKPNVYFVTMRQLIDWMRNPVPSKQMPVWLKMRCGNNASAVAGLLSDVAGPAPGELDQAIASKLSFEGRTDGYLPAILGRKILNN